MSYTDSQPFNSASPPMPISDGVSHDIPADVIDGAASSSVDMSQFDKVSFKPDKLFYDMAGQKYLYIFNHYKYLKTPFFRSKPPLQRDGTHKDVEALEHTFHKLGFEVQPFHDLKYQQIIEKIAQISTMDHSRTSCLAIAILTHGDRGGKLYAADKTYDLEDITILLENGDDSLVNKPKLFFIQACRGNLIDDGRLVHFDSSTEEDHFITVPSHSDFLFMYSTVEDHLSWRNIGGSWLIQELCRVLNTFSEYFDLLRMITIATKHVALGRESCTPRDPSTHNKKQTPETRFTLTKFVHF